MTAPAAAEAPEAGHYVVLQPSMSRSDILVGDGNGGCSYPFGKVYEREESSEPARYGSAFHELMADAIIHDSHRGSGNPSRSVDAVAARWRLTSNAADELRNHVPESFGVLREWLAGENPWRMSFLLGKAHVETPFALTPLARARKIRSHDGDHVYRDLLPGEIAGTSDLLIGPSTPSGRHKARAGYRPLLVLDHKTGDADDFSRPLEKPQLLSLAASAIRSDPGRQNARESIVGVLHARRRGLAKVYADKVTLTELKPHETALQRSLERVGDGSMKPGPWCRYCPARDVCPAQATEVLGRAGEVLVGLTAAGGVLSGGGKVTGLTVVPPEGQVTRERQLGALYEVVQQAEKLVPIIRQRIRDEVAEGAVPELSGNRILTIETVERERLSKTSILEAYGKVEGSRMLDKLREAGAIEKKQEKRLKVGHDR